MGECEHRRRQHPEDADRHFQPAIQRRRARVTVGEPPQQPRAEPEPPPEEAPRARVERDAMRPPDEIPEERPEESERELAPPEDTGPVDGSLDGVVGGTGRGRATPPPPPSPPQEEERQGPVHMPENASAPRLASGPASPVYPEEARRTGLQATCFIQMDIATDGEVKRFRTLRCPDVFHASIREWIAQTRWEPARLPDGTALRVIRTMPFAFRLSNI
jgi:hypothetical protein